MARQQTRPFAFSPTMSNASVSPDLSIGLPATAARLWLNVRVAALIVHDDHLLIHHAENDPMWVLPGGRVQHGEGTPQTLIRELKEELSYTVNVSGLIWLHEYFYEWHGAQVHEFGFYYQAHLPPSCSLLQHINTQTEFSGREGDKTLYYRWLPLAILPHTNLYPQFLQQLTWPLPSTPQHLILNLPQK
jgi:8-oxo-dGTP pyrophosphatase MutT (NUDIX family)